MFCTWCLNGNDIVVCSGVIPVCAYGQSLFKNAYAYYNAANNCFSNRSQTVSISYTVGNGLGLSRGRGSSAKHGLTLNNNASFHLPLLLGDSNT